jgi:hypothetical protein
MHSNPEADRSLWYSSGVTGKGGPTFGSLVGSTGYIKVINVPPGLIRCDHVAAQSSRWIGCMAQQNYRIIRYIIQIRAAWQEKDVQLSIVQPRKRKDGGGQSVAIGSSLIMQSYPTSPNSPCSRTLHQRTHSPLVEVANMQTTHRYKIRRLNLIQIWLSIVYCRGW